MSDTHGIDEAAIAVERIAIIKNYYEMQTRMMQLFESIIKRNEETSSAIFNKMDEMQKKITEQGLLIDDIVEEIAKLRKLTKVVQVDEEKGTNVRGQKGKKR